MNQLCLVLIDNKEKKKKQCLTIQSSSLTTTNPKKNLDNMTMSMDQEAKQNKTRQPGYLANNQLTN